ncbi:putative selenate ABC transporter substrate-binding protein, partial [Pseudomonas syringae pv. tagetis]
YYNWTVRCSLEPALSAKIKQSFLDLDPSNPDKKAILDLQASSRFFVTNQVIFKGIEEPARAAVLLK